MTPRTDGIRFSAFTLAVQREKKQEIVEMLVAGR